MKRKNKYKITKINMLCLFARLTGEKSCKTLIRPDKRHIGFPGWLRVVLRAPNSSPYLYFAKLPLLFFKSVGVLGTGVPRLTCLRPTAWLSQRVARLIFINKAFKTLARGQASRGGRRKTSQEWPSQAG